MLVGKKDLTTFSDEGVMPYIVVDTIPTLKSLQSKTDDRDAIYRQNIGA